MSAANLLLQAVRKTCEEAGESWPGHIDDEFDAPYFTRIADVFAGLVLAEHAAKLEAERTARQAAQIENEALKERLARSGVAHRQTVAVLTNALRYIEGLALADDPRDLPGIAQTVREAM